MFLETKVIPSYVVCHRVCKRLIVIIHIVYGEVVVVISGEFLLRAVYLAEDHSHTFSRRPLVIQTLLVTLTVFQGKFYLAGSEDLVIGCAVLFHLDYVTAVCEAA